MARNYLVFEAGFPCEGGWVGGLPDETNPPGRELTDCLRTILRGHTTEMSEPWDEEGYGWSFNCDLDGITINVLVQRLDYWLVTCSIVSFRPTWLRSARYPAALASVCELLITAMNHDHRFTNVRQFSLDKYTRFEKSVLPRTSGRRQ